MKPWQAIIVTIVVMIIMVIANRTEVFGVIIIASAIFVGIDAGKIKTKNYSYKFWPKSPVVWAICVWLFWIICFPAYLIIRGKIKSGQIPLSAETK